MNESIALPYHRDLVRYLRTREPRAWQRYGAPGSRAAQDENNRLELLRAGTPLDLRSFRVVYEEAARVASVLEVEVPLHLYRSPLPDEACGVRLVPLPDALHLFLEGPVVERLYIDELGALVAREMARFQLYQAEEGRYLIAARLLEAAARGPGARRSHREASRCYQLFTEILIDRSAQRLTGDLERTRIALLKAASRADVATEAASLSEPADDTERELALRLRALDLWAVGGEACEDEVAALVRGEPTLAGLDLLAQEMLSRWTHATVTSFLAPAWTRSEALLGHATALLEELELPEAEAECEPTALPVVAEEILEFAAYLLLDLATADPELRDRALLRAMDWSRIIDIGDAFDGALRRGLDLKPSDVQRLRAAQDGDAEGGGSAG